VARRSSVIFSVSGVWVIRNLQTHR
jgi:hypothetical protein